MVMSHLGRPTEGEYDEEFSLQPVVDYLQEVLDCPVRLCKDYLDGIELKAGELVVLRMSALMLAKRRIMTSLLKISQLM